MKKEWAGIAIISNKCKCAALLLNTATRLVTAVHIFLMKSFAVFFAGQAHFFLCKRTFLQGKKMKLIVKFSNWMVSQLIFMLKPELLIFLLCSLKRFKQTLCYRNLAGNDKRYNSVYLIEIRRKKPVDSSSISSFVLFQFSLASYATIDRSEKEKRTLKSTCRVIFSSPQLRQNQSWNMSTHPLNPKLRLPFDRPELSQSCPACRRMSLR